jgi:hypothetical protein
MHLPQELYALLEALTNDLPLLLRHNLIGVYLFGSLVRGGFDPRWSDVDALAVTAHNLNAREYVRLEKWAATQRGNPWLSKLELSLVRQASLLRDDPRACQLKHGRLERGGWDANAILVASVRDGGAALFGPSPAEVLPPVTPQQLHGTLRREAEYLREVLAGPVGGRRDWPCYRAYAVLTACRILYTQATGCIGTKPQAARWALRQLPPRIHPLIRLALDNRASSATGRLPLREVRALIGECQHRLDAAGTV